MQTFKEFMPPVTSSVPCMRSLKMGVLYTKKCWT